MNLDNLDKFLEKVPMHYGEAVQLYPWIKETDCEDYEWCNRTSLENASWIIEQLELRLHKLNQSSALSYVFDLEERCKKANFAPFDDRIITDYSYFVWDVNTIQIAENWLKQHHPNL